MRIFRSSPAFVLLAIAAALGVLAPPFPASIGWLIPAFILAAYTGWLLAAIQTRIRLSVSAIAIIALLSTPFVWSAYIGARDGASSMDLARSVLPYIVFLPIAAVVAGTSEKSARVNRLIWVSFLVPALTQLTLTLVILAPFIVNGEGSFLKNRLSFYDYRTVLPAILVFPAAAIARAVGGGFQGRSVIQAWGLAAAGVFGASVTLTRSLIAASLLPVIYLSITSFRRISFTEVHLTHRGRLRLAALGPPLIGVMLIATLWLLLPSLIERTQISGDGGRFSEEWPLALNAWLATTGSLVAGIGSGIPFQTTEGPRTFVHNYIIYMLLYTGIIGFMLWLGTLAVISSRGVVGRQASPERVMATWTFLLLMAFSMFFATHKLLIFNYLFSLSIGLLLRPTDFQRKPTQKTIAHESHLSNV